jgi:hypothetical protein
VSGKNGAAVLEVCHSFEVALKEVAYLADDSTVDADTESNAEGDLVNQC